MDITALTTALQQAVTNAEGVLTTINNDTASVSTAQAALDAETGKIANLQTNLQTAQATQAMDFSQGVTALQNVSAAALAVAQALQTPPPPPAPPAPPASGAQS
jgi:hypothetical protein